MAPVHAAHWVGSGGERTDFVLLSRYEPRLIAGIKRLPARDRRWDRGLEAWVISREHWHSGRRSVELTLGEPRICTPCWEGDPCSAWARVEERAKSARLGSI